MAAGHPLTARAAEEVLRADGNAYDAVVAALSAACVVEPVLASLGGGGFLLARPAQGAARVYDFFVQTPLQCRDQAELEFGPIMANFGAAQQEFHMGKGAIATPGVVAGLFHVHEDLGHMPMRDLVQPAIQYARDGVPVNVLQAYIFSLVSAIYTSNPTVTEIFGSGIAPGMPLGVDEILHLPDLANTFENLALEGADLFYHGGIAASMLEDMDCGGHLTGSDLDSYRVQVREPLELSYRGARILTNPSPSSGGLLIAFALKVLEAVEIAAQGFGNDHHLMHLAHVMSLTARARAMAEADPGGDSAWGALLTQEYVDAYRHEIRGLAPATRGTTHISVMDGDGNVAALTVSNGEGSGYIVPGTGIMLNNMLGEADLHPAGFHCWPPGSRMTSMMAPSMITLAQGGEVALGSGGSNRIRSAILQVVSNLADFGMEIRDAVEAPRIHLEDDELNVEGGYELDRLGGLLKRYPAHHLWQDRNLFFGGVHSVSRRGDAFTGTGDVRRGGVCVEVR